MLMDDITTHRLAKMLEPHMDKPAWPGLDRPATKRRVRDWLKKLGEWDEPGKEFADPPAGEPFLYRWQSMGRGSPQDKLLHKYMGLIERLALGVWANHPQADLAYLQDLLWLMGEESLTYAHETPMKRIVFTPKTLRPQMELRFEVV